MTSTIVAIDAPSIEQALSGILQALLDLALPAHHRTTPTGRMVPFRAEAGSLPAVVSALFNALWDNIVDADGAIAEVRVDGLVCGDREIVAWGYATLGSAPGPFAPIRLLEPASIAETPGRVAVRLVVDVGQE